ncbi:hypothetical protein IC235_12945 [Hymenobacter sp. BT664]|uniref:Uncharacterized protein n=1 Tax=Hymenobacter montanus TaxID=2771359 RepID=A0A927BEH6_9BACT|nr:hypothetical protein [Hymenobacter montanus]MBD2768795.1 hypothetical protein [Hymenobacter montanus]
MADINIQRKKSSPSPWILVALAAVVLVGAAYFFLRPDPADEPAGPTPAGMTAAPADTLTPGSPAYEARATPPPADGVADSLALTPETEDYSPATLAAQAATNPAAPNYAANGLQKLTGILVALADRDDLRDPAITEQRDNLTSATNRLGEPNASLRPGFVAAAGLIRAMQQKAYPGLEGAANDLVRLTGQLSGRSATAADQQQNKQFLTQAAAAVRVLSEPAQ